MVLFIVVVVAVVVVVVVVVVAVVAVVVVVVVVVVAVVVVVVVVVVVGGVALGVYNPKFCFTGYATVSPRLPTRDQTTKISRVLCFSAEVSSSGFCSELVHYAQSPLIVYF